MSNEKNNAADNKKLAIGPIDFIEMSKKEKLTLVLVFAGFLIFIGVFLLALPEQISSFPIIFLLAIMSIGFGLFLAIPYSMFLLKYPKYANSVFFMVAGWFIIVIGVSSLFTAQGYYYGLQQAISITMSIYTIVGGFILLIASSIKFLVKNVRQKKLDSMSQSDLAKMFDCPGSGNKGVVHLIKLVKDQILVKKSCPTLYPPSGVKLFRIPLRLKDHCVPYFRDAVFRCFKCGQKATVDRVILSGPWTLIKLSCPTHGNKLPTHKIWSTVYSDISKVVETTP